MLSIARNLAVFLATAMAVSGLIVRPAPEYFDDLYRHFLNDRAVVELVLIGSSRVRQIDTRVFREEAARLGHPVRCLNLGADGMITPEAEVFFRYLMRAQPERLRWVMLELDPWRLRNMQNPPEDLRLPEQLPIAQLRKSMNVSERSIWWHTPRNTLRSLHLGWRGRDTLERQVGHLVEGMHHLSPLGAGFDWFRLRRLPMEPPPEREPEAETPVPDYLRTSAEAHEAQLATIDVPDAGWDRELNARYLVSLAEGLRGLGVEPIFIIPSKTIAGSLSDARELAGLLPGEEIWSFADPAEYPELFAFERRRDRAHLTVEGNAIFARLLAARFAEYRTRRGD